MWGPLSTAASPNPVLSQAAAAVAGQHDSACSPARCTARMQSRDSVPLTINKRAFMRELGPGIAAWHTVFCSTRAYQCSRLGRHRRRAAGSIQLLQPNKSATPGCQPKNRSCLNLVLTSSAGRHERTPARRLDTKRRRRHLCGADLQLHRRHLRLCCRDTRLVPYHLSRPGAQNCSSALGIKQPPVRVLASPAHYAVAMHETMVGSIGADAMPCGMVAVRRRYVFTVKA